MERWSTRWCSPDSLGASHHLGRVRPGRQRFQNMILKELSLFLLSLFLSFPRRHFPGFQPPPRSRSRRATQQETDRASWYPQDAREFLLVHLANIFTFHFAQHFHFSHDACRHWKASSTPVLHQNPNRTWTLSSKGEETPHHSLQGSPCLLPASLISQVLCDIHPNIVLLEIMQCHVWIFWKYFASGNHVCIEFKTLCYKKDTSAHATSAYEKRRQQMDLIFFLQAPSVPPSLHRAFYRPTQLHNRRYWSINSFKNHTRNSVSC